jgi:hypothetical protein
MTKPIVVTISHHLGQAEAVLRMQAGLGDVRRKYGAFITVDEETWNGPQLTLRMRAIGQSAAAIIDVQENQLRLEVTLPWLLAKIAERFVPTIKQEGTLLLEKK